jgi:hypothetical protein
MRYPPLLFVFFFFILPFFVHAETLNVGFVQGLWYSSEPVFVGVPTRVYVAFRNNTGSDITGTIIFLENGKRIGTSEVSVLSGRIAEAWTDWTPTPGDHNLSVTLSNAEIHAVGKEPERIEVAGIVTEDSVNVDYDTDGDRVGNAEDTDDDNDGVSDEDERARGTNPLVPNPKTETEVPEERVEKPEATPQPVPEATDNEGLEKFLPDGTADALLDSVTEKVLNTKQSLDAYREERNSKLYAEDKWSTSTAGTSTDNATITRSRIEENKDFWGSLMAGVAAIFKNIYTFILWLLSKVLAHPAFVELLLLIGILYFIYRVARRIGRRPMY